MQDDALKRLKSSVTWSLDQMQHMRKSRMAAVRQFVGKHYGPHGSTDKTPVPLIETAVTVYHRRISIKSPRALVTTKFRDLLPSAADFQLALNQQLQDMNLEEAINAAGLEAMFSLGVVEIGIDENDQMFVEPVDFDDLVIDMSARRDSQLQYIGHRFRVPLEWAKKNPEFPASARSAMVASNRYAQAVSEFPKSQEELPESVVINNRLGVTEYRDYIELMQLYLVQERRLVLLDPTEKGGLLREVDWIGPPHGPYRRMEFNRVVGNILPLPPVQVLHDLHDSTNRLANKVIRQAERQKSMTLAEPHGKDDLEKITMASDGEAFAVQDTSAVREFSTGGANQQTLGMVMWLRNMFSYAAGNLDAIGGLAPTTDTVGQDSMLLQAAGTQVEQMQHQMLRFARGVVRDIAWWMWTDPVSNVPIARQWPATGTVVNYVWDARRKAGDFLSYTFDVEPYSITHQTPQQKLQAVLGLLERVVAPLMGPMAQAGIELDYERLIKVCAEYANQPELESLLRFTLGEQHPASSPQGPRGAGESKYVVPARGDKQPPRVNSKPGLDDRAAMLKLLGAGGNQSQPQA